MPHRSLPDDTPLAFLSYLVFNNEADDGVISHFREDLSREVQVQTAHPFTIFEDRNDIAWGENWNARIEQALESATFFIPVITPGYFVSEHCTGELRTFLAYERSLGRKDLVLPLVYVRSDPLDEQDATASSHELEAALFDHQVVLWPELRFTGRRDPERRRRLAELALQIRKAINRTQSSRRSRYAGTTLLTSGGSPREDERPLRFGSVLTMATPNAQRPRQLLEEAMRLKQAGEYEAAWRLHQELVAEFVEWDQEVDLFVAHLYLAISLHDKMEAWPEIDVLERSFVRPMIARLRRVLGDSAVHSISVMHETSMAVLLLRQTRLEEAHERVRLALAVSPGRGDDTAASILHANALVARALVLHAQVALGEANASQLHDARADLEAAELLYRRHAAMGEPDELHHLGRFYGTRAFVTVARARAGETSLTGQAETLLADARRAHEGENRTRYGRTAGLYCEAYCLSRLAASEEGDPATRARWLQAALERINAAAAGLDQTGVLGRQKVSRLTEQLLRLAGEDEDSPRLAAARAASATFAEALREKGFGRLARVSRNEWLETPLN